MLPTLVLNHQTMICAVSRHCSVTISSSGIELWSFLLYISRTIDSRFHIPSGSRPKIFILWNMFWCIMSFESPLRGLRKEDHSAALGGAVVDR